MKADKKKVEILIKTAKGQLEGVLKMIEDDRYCIEISNQIMAANAVLNKANREILAAHMKNCVLEAAKSDDGEEKIDELIKVINKLF